MDNKKMPAPVKAETLVNEKYLKFHAVDFDNGAHYLIAGRRPKEDLFVFKSEKERRTAYPDAVTCFIIAKSAKKAPRLLLQYEYRYPAGDLLLSPTAGLIDEADRKNLSVEEAILLTAAREIKEETGLLLGVKDEINILNNALFSSPGMTDETNALVSCIIHLPDEGLLNTRANEGTEVISGFEFLTRRDAEKILKKGVDKNGVRYSVYTLAALLYFLSEDWE